MDLDQVAALARQPDELAALVETFRPALDQAVVFEQALPQLPGLLRQAGGAGERPGADAIASKIDLIVVEGNREHTADLSTFPPTMRLREIRELLKSAGRKARLYVQEVPSRE